MAELTDKQRKWYWDNHTWGTTRQRQGQMFFAEIRYEETGSMLEGYKAYKDPSSPIYHDFQRRLRNDKDLKEFAD